MRNFTILQKWLLICVFALSASWNAQTFVNESFTGSTLPASWNLLSTSTITNYFWTPYGGTNGIVVEEQNGTAQNELLISPSMNLTNATNPYITFKVSLYGLASFKTNNTADFKIIATRDNFATSTVIWSENDITDADFLNSNFSSKTISKSLSAFTGTGNSNVKIGIRYQSTGTGANYASYAQVTLLKVSTDCPATSTRSTISNTITWFPVENFTGTYDIEYGPWGFTQGTGTTVTGLTGTSYTLPKDYCGYYAYIRTNCGATQSAWNMGYYNNPVNVTSNTNSTTNNSATINWSTNASSVDIEYGSDGFTPGNGILVTGITGTSYNLTGLFPCSKYNYYIRSNCGNGTVGAWNSKTIISTRPNSYNTAISLPYTETFDATLCTLGYTNINGNSESGSINNNRLKMIGNNVYVSSIGGYSTRVESRPMSLTANQPITIKFDYSGVYAGNNQSLYVIMQNTSTGVDYPITNIVMNGNTVTSQSNLLFTPPTTGNYRLVFKTYYNSTYGYYIDNLSILNCGLAVVRDFSAGWSDSVLTTTSSATLNFNKNCDSYDVEYGLSGFTLGTGTQLLGNTGTTININNLSPCTTYSLYYRTNCGGTLGAWKIVNFTTKNPTAYYDVPYYQNFDTSAKLCETNWKRQRGLFDLDNIQKVLLINSNPYVPLSDYNSDKGITPGIALYTGTTYLIKYKITNTEDPSWNTVFTQANPTLKVSIGTSEDVSTHTTIKDYGTAGIPYSANSTYTNETIEFTPTVSGAYFIGFYVPNGLQTGRYYLDDFSVTEKPTLATVETNSKDTAITLYPNPTKDTLYFSEELSDIQVYDASGKNVISSKAKSKEISVNQLLKGNYILSGKTKNGTSITKKFIKE